MSLRIVVLFAFIALVYGYSVPSQNEEQSAANAGDTKNLDTLIENDQIAAEEQSAANVEEIENSKSATSVGDVKSLHALLEDVFSEKGQNASQSAEVESSSEEDIEKKYGIKIHVIRRDF